MIRIADILSSPSPEDESEKAKKKSPPAKEQQPPPNIELVKNSGADSNPAKIPEPSSSADKILNGSASVMELSKSMLDKVKLGNQQEAQGLYDEMVKALGTICHALTISGAVDLTRINNQLNSLIDQIVLGNEEFLILTNRQYPVGYLYFHMVNVAVLSMVLAKHNGLPKTRLAEIGLGALLHDVGLVTFEHIISSPDKLTDNQYEQIKRHPVLGQEMLARQKGLPQAIMPIIVQHHERLDGSGYPYGLKGVNINEDAQLVALVDVYEALTHKRAYRDRTLNDNAMRLLVERKNVFNPRLLKVLIETISLFPLASWVRLSSGEIAKVVKINKASLLKPVVQIFFDRKGKHLEAEKDIDLSKQPNIYVKEQVIDEAVESLLKS